MSATPFELRSYETMDGQRPFDDWLYGLKDMRTRTRILARLNRVALGNMGDKKPVGEGVGEFRMKFGSGFRVYFGQDGDELIILLCGGDKGSQSRDIQLAKEYWQDYKRRKYGKSE